MEHSENRTSEPPTPMTTEPPLDLTAWNCIIYASAPTIFILGIIGNILTAIIMLNLSFRRMNISVYLLALAVVDTVCLFSQRLTRLWLEHVFGLIIDVLSPWGCKILMFVHYGASCSSSWLICAVTLERVFVAYFPYRAKALCSRWRAKVVTVLVIMAAFIANTYTIVLFEPVRETDGYLYCQQKTGFIRTTTMIDFAFYSLVPSIILFSGNVLLILRLYKRIDFRRSSLSGELGSVSRETRRTTSMLITVSLTFLVLTTPVSIYYVIASFIDIPTTSEILVCRIILQVLSSSNHAVNFLLYCISGRVFRRALMRTCTCRQPFHKRTTSSTGGRDGSHHTVAAPDKVQVDNTKRVIEYSTWM